MFRDCKREVPFGLNRELLREIHGISSVPSAKAPKTQ